MTKREQEQQEKAQRNHLLDRIAGIRYSYDDSDPKEPDDVAKARKTIKDYEARKAKARDNRRSDWRKRLTKAREAVLFLGPVKALPLVEKLEADAVIDD